MSSSIPAFGRPEPLWLRLLKNPLLLIGLILILALLGTALFASRLAPYNPDEFHVRQRLSPPGSEFWFGTDEYGRDILSRLIWGTHSALTAIVMTQATATALGILLGVSSGWYGGWLDMVVMRISDALLALPGLLFLLIWVSLVGSNRASAFFALGIISWTTEARLIRSLVLTHKNQLYIVAAKAAGATDRYIMLRHILPNVIGPSITLASLGAVSVVMIETSFSFVGISNQDTLHSWGQMIEIGRQYITTAWWYAFFPGAMIVITALGFNFFGEGLRHYLLHHER